MKDLSFLDYLNAMDTLLGDSKAAEVTRIEIKKIREHTASITTMQKHLKHFQSIKKMLDNGIELNV